MDFSLQANSVVRPFSGAYRHPIVSRTLIILTIVGTIPAMFSPSFPEYIVVMLLLIYLSYYYLQSVFSVGIFVALLYQWIQVSIKVLWSITTGDSLDELTQYPDNISSALFLSAISLFVLSEGMRSKLKKIRFDITELNDVISQYSTKRVLVLYLVFNVIMNLLFTLRFTIPGLFQAIAILSYFKWSLFIIMMILVIQKREMTLPFIILVGFEFLSSLVSFFASFRGIILYLIIGSLTLNKVSKRQLFTYGSAAILIYMFAIIWTDIKMDYRAFVNKGTSSQAVLVSRSEARSYLFNAINSYNFSNYKEVQEELINRISYIDFFSATQSYVPEKLPYESGKILKQSISHIIMPRLFFPGKPIVEDSKHLSKYTGVYFPSYAEGVSFSLGYTGDFYIDFGPVWMFMGIFLFGFLLGSIFLAIHNSSINILWSIGALSAAFDLLYKFENSQIKFFGNAIYFFIIFMLLNRFVIPHLHQFLIDKR